MGACCGRNESYAYRTELGSSFVEELMPRLKLSENVAQVIVIRLKEMTLIKERNPYVEMKLKHPDAISGVQYQRSTFKPQTLKPKWVRPFLPTMPKVFLWYCKHFC